MRVEPDLPIDDWYAFPFHSVLFILVVTDILDDEMC